ncbi:branched-chain amino acid transport system II carrier protein [Mesobacillus zeae]|uniref:Branched-chain amino acid transport system carrier protein n=1 Tax=Mesobacillus zeae TaxID=1917180 RepID=A0A398B8Y4_9BACI|nr:branched-chain amino acid transport system II carrier protein [Mesobacillus zeae]RID86287.1 branched-chain amino acid transport system II carrier protein [Mesobacillus zeae]
MEKYRSRDTLFIGLTLFALFFGAGNLIFPPFLGIMAGENFWPAIIGFVVTGVGLPLITVVAIASVKDGVQEMSKRVHPVFAVVFTVAVYLSLGPFFGIPRGANVAYEMSLKPFLGNSAGPIFLLAFTAVFFALVYWVCLNPSKLVDRVGTVLTPIMLIAIALLVIVSLFKLDGGTGAVADKFSKSPFTAGFLEGYLTMDTIAALAFGIIVITSIKQKQVTDRKQVVRLTLKAGLIAGAGLAMVYVSLGLLGTKMAGAGNYENGGQLLTEAAKTVFGYPGMLLLGVIVTLACFTTCVGLVAATGQYFTKLLPKVSYKQFATIITIISFLIANMGLNQIISVSVPVLVTLYPITIVLVVLSLLHPFFGGARAVYVGSILAALLVSISDGLKAMGVRLPELESLLGNLPLYAEGLGWLVPAIVGAAAGLIADRFILSKLERRQPATDN